MSKTQLWASLILSPFIGYLVAWAGSQYGQTLNGIPLYGLCVSLAFLINWLLFIPAFLLQTEKFFDLTGSFTYISITLFTLTQVDTLDSRTLMLSILVIIWAGRLGTFLFRRIQRAGKDDRFDSLKPDFFYFLNVWTLQGLWVSLTAAPAFIAITASQKTGLDFFTLIGLLIWLIGFTIEVVADRQKSQFKANPNNEGRFIQSGLWAISRHPNYLGEIILWLGVTIIAIPTFQGGQWIGLISPIFVYLLLNFVSGVPMLEAKADQKWGGQTDYEAYKANTPKLWPRWRARV